MWQGKLLYNKNNRVVLRDDFAFFTITKQDGGVRSYTLKDICLYFLKTINPMSFHFFPKDISWEKKIHIYDSKYCK